MMAAGLNLNNTTDTVVGLSDVSSHKNSTLMGSASGGIQSHYTRQSIPALPVELLTLKNAKVMKSQR